VSYILGKINYHLQPNKPIVVTFANGTKQRRKVGAGERVCLWNETWADGEEALVIVHGTEDKTLLKTLIYIRR